MQYEGAAVKAGYNYRYLLDVLGVLDGDAVSVEIIDTLSPTLLRDPGRDELLFVGDADAPVIDEPYPPPHALLPLTRSSRS